MTDPQRDDDGDPKPFDESMLDRALAGGFAAPAEPEAAAGHSVLEQIRERAGDVPSVSLRDADSAGYTPMLKPLGPDDARAAGKYVVQGVIGAGGVGTVHRGHDQDLGRDVAMKFLHDRYKDDPTILQRFVEEAQIGGQLQHPGIVPVYELGLVRDRPFFTMKLVKGETLAKKLADRTSPADDRQTFLSIFEDVCQTMAYAHARGVVHRDLKPANIMIGSFGEVQVVDWGMGKVLQAGGIGDERRAIRRQSEVSTVETVRSQSNTNSVLGSVIGTPAYMPPEQARGDVEQMDERSDVFSLGAILCEVLTGQPPYVGRQQEILGMAAMCRLDDAHRRLAACGADAELVDLATQCMTPAPAARPQSAEVLAAAIHRFLTAAEARAHDARVEAAAARVRAESMRRTQTLGLALMGAVAVGLAISLWLWQDSSAQRALAEQAATSERQARRLADDRAEEARANLAKFDQLSFVIRLAAAKVAVQEFHPAWPERAPAMRRWLDDDAAALGAALPELRETVAELQQRALESTAAERAEDRRTHPRVDELAALLRRLAALRQADEVRAGRREPELIELDAGARQQTAEALEELAWALVDPERSAFGREAEGLALARRAVAQLGERGPALASATDTLAWAFYANGLDDEAVAASEAAIAVASEERRAFYEGRSDDLRAAIADTVGSAGRAALARLAEEVAELEAEVGRRRTWRFADPADQFLHDTLSALVADIDTFAATEVVAVRRLLTWAERVEELTVTRFADRWNEARIAILAADGVTASRRYAAARFELKPQLGLVPIGMNPKSGLWEFYHLRSAWDPDEQDDPAAIEVPTHDAEGRIDATGRGIVFVLIPGSRFHMGAQANDPGAPNFDPLASRVDGPVHEVELAPYFIATHELTQGQWARLDDGREPSWYRMGRKYTGIPGRIGDNHPVEQVSWTMCHELLDRHGLELPTEAQWEFACRAGTDTPWFTGRTPGSLEGYANVLDRTGHSVPPKWPQGEEFDDHFKGTAPVGTFAPNAFGLCDVHGNVWEWCLDRYASYTAPARAGDGLRLPPDPLPAFAMRGGSNQNAANDVRSSHRADLGPEYRRHNVGIRAARAVMP